MRRWTIDGLDGIELEMEMEMEMKMEWIELEMEIEMEMEKIINSSKDFENTTDIL